MSAGFQLSFCVIFPNLGHSPFLDAVTCKALASAAVTLISPFSGGPDLTSISMKDKKSS